MKNIVIFGGAFDPIHNGHVNMAINASKALNAEVFFVPARVSVWKEGSGASAKERIKMIELAIKESGYSDVLHVSDIEANSKKEKNYSIDTVKFFKEKYPNDNLYFLLGTDHVNLFDKWKDAELMASLANIVYFSRPGYINDQNMIEHYNMQEIVGELNDISSTDIREMRSFEIADSVLYYILDHKLYFASKVRSYIGEKRYNHSASVAKLAYEIAKSNHIKDTKDYLIAGLIHDIGKEVEKDKQISMMKSLYPEFKDFPFVIYHQFIGEYLVKKDFGIENQDILNAVKYHTTGRANMSTLEKCIYASDKIEPTRGFDSQDLINKMKVNIDKGFIAVLTANQEYFKVKKIPYDNSLTKECFDYYLK